MRDSLRVASDGPRSGVGPTYMFPRVNGLKGKGQPATVLGSSKVQVRYVCHLIVVGRVLS